MFKCMSTNFFTFPISLLKDENEDGYFSLEELSKWLETNKILKLSEEGRDAEIDKIIKTQASKTKEKNEQQEKGDN